MANFNSHAEANLAQQIANLDLSLINLSLQQQKALQEMEATLATLQESVTKHQGEQDLLSPFVKQVTTGITIARERLANFEMQEFGDLDIYEGEYDSDYDSEFEDTQSDAGSVFYAALGRMWGEPQGEPLGPVQGAPQEGPRQGGRKGYLVFVFLIFLLAGFYFFNKI
ncbi:hypothetical protein B9Z19DRAFT_1196473 [Tuber borchii]|uniref:Uncharacterized protein n=1 Tax=Tuber borchii TaxID=42251 RepID=A0A2T6ZF53_TUBBO|nr:hypothetical protein B9Z19DRAFT_1196473 [Tuber borchii]